MSDNDLRKAAIDNLVNHDLSKDAKVSRFIRWMGDKALSGKPFRVDQFSICREFILDDSDRRKDSTAKKDLLPTETLKARQFVIKVQRYINRCYVYDSHAGNPAEVLFVEIPGKEEVLFSPLGAYTLRFSQTFPFKKLLKPVKKKTERRQSADVHRPGIAAVFWERMISAAPPGKAVLIYSNEQPEFGKAIRTNGKYSGSGEVAAAFLIGNRVADLDMPFSIRRSKQLADQMKEDQDFLLLQWSCLVFLGCSESNSALRIIREEDTWQEKQHYHFEKWGKKQALYRAPLGKREGPRHTSGEDTDYALISYLKNKKTNQVLIAMAGTDTGGTWGAARFLCEDKFVQELLDALDISAEEPLPSFEVFLKISMVKSRPAKIEMSKPVKN